LWQLAQIQSAGGRASAGSGGGSPSDRMEGTLALT